MATPNDIPEEDHWFIHPLLENPVHVKSCQHKYVECYYGAGTDISDVNIMWQWVFCEKCLHMERIKIDQSRMRLNAEAEEERES